MWQKHYYLVNLGEVSGEGNGTPFQYSCLENPMDGGAWWAAVHGVARCQTRPERLHFPFSLSCIGEGNGNPLQCSCLENRRDGGAWWAAVCGVAQSRTRLKRLGSIWVFVHCSLTFFSNKIKHTSYFKIRFKNGSSIMFCLLMYVSMHIDICSLYKSFALHVFIIIFCMFLIQ